MENFMRDMLLINADDFGFSKAVNDGVVYCFKNNLVDRATVMINMPYAEDARKLSEEKGFLERVGLHLNIVEGKPLTEEIKMTLLCDKDGLFDNKTLRKVKNRLYLDKRTRNALEKEIEAQIQAFFSMGFTLKHIDSHQHSHNNLSVLDVLLPIASNKFESIRIPRNIPKNEIGWVKLLYKKYIITRLDRINRRGKSVKRFGSYYDIEKYIALPHALETIEIETHPAIFNGRLVDLYNDESRPLAKYSG